jgi:hypothetical protein
MENIGFKAPENPDKKWESKINRETFIFTKTREKSGVFTYSCGRVGKDTKSWTGFYSPRDLEPAEIEKLPQFDSFIGRGPAVKSATT